MKKYILILLSFAFCIISFSQNLVVNGDFENYYDIPKTDFEIRLCVNCFSVQSTPDYFHKKCKKRSKYNFFSTSVPDNTRGTQ